MAWDTSMKALASEEKVHIVFARFDCPDTNLGIKFSLGGLYVQSVVKHVSVHALTSIHKNLPNAIRSGEGVVYNRVKNLTKLGITMEQVIPVEALFQHFLALHEKHVLSEQTILDVLPKLEIAIITKEENRKLNAARLSKKMPEGWWNSAALDPFERYRVAGLDDSIWATEFLQDAVPGK